MKLKTILWILVALLLLAYAGSPYLAVHDMRSAARVHDAAKLGGYVDFTSLRESLKTGVHVKLLGKERTDKGEPTPANAMGAAVASALLGPMVDALITPESLSRVLQGQNPAAAAVGGAVGTQDAPAGALDVREGYESLNRFVFSVKKKDADEEPVDLFFRREGLFSWKLAELRLP